MNISAGDTTSSVGLPRMRAKTARWASRDDSKAGDELGGRNIWLLVVVGGVSSRTPLSLCLSLVCVTGSSGPSLLHASHMRTDQVFCSSTADCSPGGPRQPGHMSTFRPDLNLVANPLLDSQSAFSTYMWHPKPSWKSNRWERYFNAARSLSSLNGWDSGERISDST